MVYIRMNEHTDININPIDDGPVVEQGGIPRREEAEGRKARGAEEEDELAVAIAVPTAAATASVVVVVVVVVGVGGGGEEEGGEGLGLADRAVEGGACMGVNALVV